MKYIKKFESNKPFEIGDIVRTIVKEQGFEDRIGYISAPPDYHQAYSVIFLDDDTEYYFKFRELKTATPEEIEQYKLEIAAKKYNL